MATTTIRVSDLYDKIVDEFNIPAQVLQSESREVREYLSGLPKDKLEKLELHVRRLQDKNRRGSSHPIVEILTLRYHNSNEYFLDVGSATFLSVHFVDIEKI